MQMCRQRRCTYVRTYIHTYLQNDKVSIFIAEHHMLEGSVVTLACHSDSAGLCWSADPLQCLSWGAGLHGEVDHVWGHLGGRREEGWSEGVERGGERRRGEGRGGDEGEGMRGKG